MLPLLFLFVVLTKVDAKSDYVAKALQPATHMCCVKRKTIHRDHCRWEPTTTYLQKTPKPGVFCFPSTSTLGNHCCGAFREGSWETCNDAFVSLPQDKTEWSPNTDYIFIKSDDAQRVVGRVACWAGANLERNDLEHEPLLAEYPMPRIIHDPWSGGKPFLQGLKNNDSTVPDWVFYYTMRLVFSVAQRDNPLRLQYMGAQRMNDLNSSLLQRDDRNYEFKRFIQKRPDTPNNARNQIFKMTKWEIHEIMVNKQYTFWSEKDELSTYQSALCRLNEQPADGDSTVPMASAETALGFYNILTLPYRPHWEKREKIMIWCFVNGPWMIPRAISDTGEWEIPNWATHSEPESRTHRLSETDEAILTNLLEKYHVYPKEPTSKPYKDSWILEHLKRHDAPVARVDRDTRMVHTWDTIPQDADVECVEKLSETSVPSGAGTRSPLRGSLHK
eukprot:g5071.t1